MSLDCAKEQLLIAPDRPASDYPKPGSHIPALDSVRGLAIILVTVFRFSVFADGGGQDLPTWLAETLRLGDKGVDLFFVLSGFLITGILYDAKQTRYYFRNFYMRRTLRIFPLYYGVLFLAFVVIPLLAPAQESLFPESAHQLWLWLYGANVLSAVEGTWTVLGSFNHFWSLAVEEHFYLLWPLVIFFCSRRQAMGVCWFFILLAPALRIAIILSTRNFVATEGLTPCRMDALAMGGLIALAVRGPNGFADLIGLAKVMLVASGCLLAIVTLSGKNLLGIPYSLNAIFFACTILLAVIANPASLLGRFWNLGLLRFFGKYSYGLYIFQNPLIPICFPVISVGAFTERVGSPIAGTFLYIAVMTTLTLALALISWNVYEKQFLKLKVYFEAKNV